MKKAISFLLVFMLLVSVVPAFAQTDYSFLEELDDQELTDLRGIIDDMLKERKKDALQSGDEEEVEATRSNPAPINAPVLYKEDSYTGNEYTIRTVCIATGDAASAVLKSFNKYNVRRLNKGEEWVLVMLHIEALASDSDRVDLSDYYFHFVSKDGVEYENSYISDNPAPVKALYVDSSQYAWVAAIVKQDDTPCLTYKNYSSDVTAWFSLTDRLYTGDEIAAASLEKGDSGDDVSALQRLLLEMSYLKAAPNGDFDKNTVSAVKSFQKANGLKASGIADEETLQLIMSGKAE